MAPHEFGVAQGNVLRGRIVSDRGDSQLSPPPPRQVDRMDLALIRDWGGKVRLYGKPKALPSRVPHTHKMFVYFVRVVALVTHIPQCCCCCVLITRLSRHTQWQLLRMLAINFYMYIQTSRGEKNYIFNISGSW